MNFCEKPNKGDDEYLGTGNQDLPSNVTFKLSPTAGTGANALSNKAKHPEDCSGKFTKTESFEGREKCVSS